MKQQLLLGSSILLAACFFIKLPADAQHFPVNNKQQATVLKYFKMPLSNPHLQQKPTKIQGRLVGAVPAYYTGSGYFPDDSVHLFWSSPRTPNITGMTILNRLSTTGDVFPNVQQQPRPDDYFFTNCDSSCAYPWNGAYYDAPVSKYISTFDAQGNVITYLSMSYLNANWQNYAQSENTYDNHNNLTGIISKKWMNNDWENTDGNDYSYDTDDHLTRSVTLDWLNNQWDSSHKTVYTYNANGRPTSEIKKKWDGTHWTNDSMLTYTYNANGLQDTAMLQTWDGVSAWLDHGRSIYIYDANGDNTITIDQQYYSGAWKNDMKWTYEFNGKVLTSAIYQEWDVDSAAFENMGKMLFEYNTYDQVTLLKTEQWTSSGSWATQAGDLKFSFYYEEYDDETNVKNVASTEPFKLYPNPATDELHIDAGKTSIDQFRIIDLTGKVVYQSKPYMHTTALTVSLANFAAGVYLLQLNGLHQDQKATREFIIRR